MHKKNMANTFVPKIVDKPGMFGSMSGRFWFWYSHNLRRNRAGKVTAGGTHPHAPKKILPRRGNPVFAPFREN